jgi:hypothetical protein
MARYRIAKTATAARIELTEVGDKQRQPLDQFQECAQGRCSCRTNEYDKLASIQVVSDDDGIDIRLESKPGSEFDTSQIANCLDHTLAAGSGSSTSERASETGVR